jgi:hypothetical protein
MRIWKRRVTQPKAPNRDEKISFALCPIVLLASPARRNPTEITSRSGIEASPGQKESDGNHQSIGD